MHPIILYDGICGLCNQLVQFILTHDREGQLRFASLQSEFAAKVLARHGISNTDLDTFHVVLNYEQPHEQILSRSDAVVRVGRELGRQWRLLATIAAVLPRFIRDPLYNFIARRRYRVFGKYDSCMMPDPAQRSRFLDI
jgi:predicted DCC family thiol-disulfide oxidoreductase YuxK